MKHKRGSSVSGHLNYLPFICIRLRVVSATLVLPLFEGSDSKSKKGYQERHELVLR